MPPSTRTASSPAEIVHAASLYRPLRRASRLARTSGLILLSGGCGLVLLDVFTASDTLLLGLALATLAALEWQGGAALQRAESVAPARLALNQLLVFMVLGGYATLQLAAVNLDPDLRTVLGAVVVFSAVVQGAMATYYFTCRARLERFRSATDSWVHELMRLDP